MLRRGSSQAGFTLLEVLVAIAVFAVVAAGVYRVLSAMVESQDRIISHSRDLRELQRALWVMETDLGQLVMRDAREPNDDRSPAFIADKDDYLLQFTRQGWQNPLLFRRSDLQRVAYSLGPEPLDPDDKDSAHERDKYARHLLRHTWSAVDPMDDDNGHVQVLLRDVEEVELSFLNEKGDWKKDWPEKKLDDKEHSRLLPEAVRLAIKTKKKGRIERLFQTGNVVHKEKVGQEKKR